MKTSSQSIQAAILFLLAAGLLSVVNSGSAYAADAAAKPDVLVFSNGDTLTGKLDYEAGGTVFFKSDNAGTVQVPWAKLKSLHTEEPFAVIETGVSVARKDPAHEIPEGTLTINGDTLTVNMLSGAREIPVKNIAYLIDQTTFDKNVYRKQGLLRGITGSVTAGVSTVTSTQNSVSINSAVVLARAVPPVTWMPARQRTLLNFNNSYGQVTQPNTPTVKTNILHGSLEEDEYLSPRFYLLQHMMFDHNYSQGLDLQQMYGFGAGYTVIKNDKQELDVTGDVNYTRQEFAAIPPAPGTSTDIIGSSFGDNYVRKFPRKIVFTEVGAFNAAWNHPSDYSASIALGAAFPVYKNFGFSLGLIDNYLNNPPAGFKSNSLQFTTGLTYAIAR